MARNAREEKCADEVKKTPTHNSSRPSVRVLRNNCHFPIHTICVGPKEAAAGPSVCWGEFTLVEKEGN